MLGASGTPAGTEHLHGLLSRNMRCGNTFSLLLHLVQKVTNFLGKPHSPPVNDTKVPSEGVLP